MRVTVCLFLLTLLSMSAHAHNDRYFDANVLKIYSEEDFEPYNYKDQNGKMQGIAIDIVEKILENAKFKHTSIKMIPWARSYYLAQYQPNTLLFSIYRTPIREDLFDWVGPIGKSKIVIFVKKGKTIDPENYTVAAVRDSASHQAVLKKGVNPSRILALNDNTLGATLLDIGRVDAWAVSYVNAIQKIKENNLNIQDYYIYETLSETDLYLGFNKDTDPEIKNYFSEKLEELRKSGFIERTHLKYGY